MMAPVGGRCYRQSEGALSASPTPRVGFFLQGQGLVFQGEGGIRVPPPGYLAECARICREANVLLICDEVQTGLGRTGALFACQHEGVAPDAIVLGKALADARLLCRRLMEHGALTRETQGSVLRPSPLLTISRRELDEALRAIATHFAELGLDPRHGGEL